MKWIKLVMLERNIDINIIYKFLLIREIFGYKQNEHFIRAFYSETHFLFY